MEVLLLPDRFFEFKDSLSKTDCENLSISLSVTSHKLATRVGLESGNVNE